MSVLCVGPRNAGKTMLLNSIQYPGSVNFTTHSVNTVGTNIYTIHYNLEKPLKKSQAKKSVTIRELGGEMAVMWKNYYTEAVAKIMFVVDTSNLCQISCAGKIFARLFLLAQLKLFPLSPNFVFQGVLLYSILSEPKLQKAKICLVLTKMDYAYRQMRNEALLMLQIEKLKTQVPQEITIIEASAITREGLDQIVEWLFNWV